MPCTICVHVLENNTENDNCNWKQEQEEKQQDDWRTRFWMQQLKENWNNTCQRRRENIGNDSGLKSLLTRPCLSLRYKSQSTPPSSLHPTVADERFQPKVASLALPVSSGKQHLQREMGVGRMARLGRSYPICCWGAATGQGERRFDRVGQRQSIATLKRRGRWRRKTKGCGG